VALSRFFTEARAADAIRHPNIVEIYDYGTLPSGAPYIAMEYLEGETLADRLGRGPISLGESLDIVIQAASALGAAHGKEVLHRDLKPDNLFLVGEPGGRLRVKIVDFGIAKLQNDLSELSHRTRTGALIGTPLYMSPEQCLGIRDIGPPSDLYALGVIAYELLCGRPPFEAEAVGALINMHVNEPVLSPRKLNPKLPRSLEALLLKTLSKAPENRFGSMAELEAELHKVRGQIEQTTPELLASAPERRPSRPLEAVTVPATITTARRHAPARPAARRLVVGGVLLGAGAAALLVFLQRRPGPSPAPRPMATVVVPAPAPPPPAPAPARISLQLESEPPGATVIVGDQVVGRTPTAWVTSPGTDPVELVFALDGYRREAIQAIPADGLKVRARLEPLRHRAGKKAPAPQPPADDIKSER
jgi:serine/threonine-protein kinase